MRTLMTHIAVAAVAAFSFSSALSQYSGAVPPPDRVAKGFEAIGVADAKDWVYRLASDEFEGRGTGQPGFQKAAEWVAGKLKEFGLKPIGDNGTYFQGVPFTFNRIDPDSVSASSGNVNLGNKDVALTGATGVNASGKLAIVRTRNKDARIADAGSLSGRIVIIAAPLDGTLARPQSLNALGAAGVLRVSSNLPESEWVRGRGQTRQATRANGFITPEGARKFATLAGLDASSVDSAFAGDEAEIILCDIDVSLSAEIQTEQRTVPNVVGLLEGSDPTLKEEVVCIGAHLDHLGVRNGVIYYGADDDASGCTAVLLIAKAFAANPIKPKRSIMFLFFTGEEMGLVGSRYYTENPIIPLEKTTALLQLDMVGRNEETANDKPEDNINTIHLVGSKRISMELHNAIVDLNGHINLVFEYDQEDVYTRSDHYMFAQKGVPVAFLFSGFHPDYHQPTDTPDKINYDKIVSAARLFYLVADYAANRDELFPRGTGGQ